eukprot:502504-Rhodomonas_salina.1
MGLDEFNGRPVGDDLEAQMKCEFHRELKWKAHNYQIETTGELEWEFVVQPDPKKLYPGQTVPGGRGDCKTERRSINLEELLNLPL